MEHITQEFGITRAERDCVWTKIKEKEQCHDQ